MSDIRVDRVALMLGLIFIGVGAWNIWGWAAAILGVGAALVVSAIGGIHRD